MTHTTTSTGGLPQGVATPAPQEIHVLMSMFAEGRLDEAMSMAQSLTERFPLHGLGWNMLGMALQMAGRTTDALSPMRKAAALAPGNADAHYNLGGVLKELGRMEEAEASYRRVLQLRPGDAGAYAALGDALMELGRIAEAESSYRHALRISPDLVEAHSNLALLLKETGRLEEAEICCRRALQLKPGSTDILNNLALLLYTQGQLAQALEVARQSLRMRETPEAKNFFVACAKRLHFSGDDAAARSEIARALSEAWGAPNELMRIASGILQQTGEIAVCMERANGEWPKRIGARELFGAHGLAAVGADPLLHALLDTAPVCDMEMERFLTIARAAMLAEACEAEVGEDHGHGRSFYAALARQCFINEYVFSTTSEELAQVTGLRDKLVAALADGAPVRPIWLSAVAAYFPLCSMKHHERLLERQWPPGVEALLCQQVREPQLERQLRAGIRRLTAIEDEVSQLVQNQYEENPYPRWVRPVSPGQTKSLHAYLRSLLPAATLGATVRSGVIDVLIAGCGTGKHSIQVAQALQQARVLAVDLSSASLGYAMRKTQELGIETIEYAQADLLKLGSIGREFDLIESAGVLHHLDDPWAGWRVLLSLLRPGGYMMLGFYSEVARRNIVKARNFIAEGGYASTADDIRRCRQDLVDADSAGNGFGNAVRNADFFSTSACRDLLFHVQEHRMTLDGIAGFLRDNGLTFLGFEIDSGVLQSYRRRFPGDPSAVNLEQWQVFENENPDTFFGMYQFWVRKT